MSTTGESQNIEQATSAITCVYIEPGQTSILMTYSDAPDNKTRRYDRQLR